MDGEKLSVVGSPFWMAPEVLRDEPYNEKVSRRDPERAAFCPCRVTDSNLIVSPCPSPGRRLLLRHHLVRDHRQDPGRSRLPASHRSQFCSALTSRPPPRHLPNQISNSVYPVYIKERAKAASDPSTIQQLLWKQKKFSTI